MLHAAAKAFCGVWPAVADSARPMLAMRQFVAALLVFLLVHAPAHADPPPASARAGLDAQIAAWNRGDLEGALAAYLAHPSMAWISAGGVSRGFDAFAADMRAQFGDHPEEMGRYSAEMLDERVLTHDLTLLVVRWRIELDGKKLFGGVSTQLWQRSGERWLCVLEHAA